MHTPCELNLFRMLRKVPDIFSKWCSFMVNNSAVTGKRCLQKRNLSVTHDGSTHGICINIYIYISMCKNLKNKCSYMYGSNQLHVGILIISCLTWMVWVKDLG